MTAPGAKPAFFALVLGLGGAAASAAPCPLTGPNLLSDPDFRIEAEDPASMHWTQSRHAGAENAYRVSIEDGELTIEKVAKQDWFYFGQRVPWKKKSRKLAFTAELKLDLSPPEGPYAARASGGLDIAARTGSGNVFWTSWRNHEPRIGRTDWKTVQVVFAVPKKTHTLDVGFMHEAEGTLQVRNPSLRAVDESGGTCAVTPDRSSQVVEEPLR